MTEFNDMPSALSLSDDYCAGGIHTRPLVETIDVQIPLEAE